MDLTKHIEKNVVDQMVISHLVRLKREELDELQNRHRGIIAQLETLATLWEEEHGESLEDALNNDPAWKARVEELGKQAEAMAQGEVSKKEQPESQVPSDSDRQSGGTRRSSGNKKVSPPKLVEDQPAPAPNADVTRQRQGVEGQIVIDDAPPEPGPDSE